jgi:hypothetical protein
MMVTAVAVSVAVKEIKKVQIRKRPGIQSQVIAGGAEGVLEPLTPTLPGVVSRVPATGSDLTCGCGTSTTENHRDSPMLSSTSGTNLACSPCGAESRRRAEAALP